MQTMNSSMDEIVVSRILLFVEWSDWTTIKPFLVNNKWHHVFSSELFAQEYYANLKHLSEQQQVMLRNTLQHNWQTESAVVKKRKYNSSCSWCSGYWGILKCWVIFQMKALARRKYLENIKNHMINDDGWQERLFEIAVHEKDESLLRKGFAQRCDGEFLLAVDSLERIASIPARLICEHFHIDASSINSSLFLERSHILNEERTALMYARGSAQVIDIAFTCFLDYGYPIRVQIEYAFSGVRNCNDYTGKQTVYMNGDEVFDIYSAESMETKLQVMSDKLTDMERNIFYIENSNLLYEGVFGQDQKFEVNYDNLLHTILLKFFNPNFFIRRERHYLEGIDFITYENVKTTLYYNSIFTN